MSNNRLCGIFSLEGIQGESKIKINHLNNVTLKEQEHIQDTLIKQYNIMENVVGEIYSCNITDLFLMSTKKLPMLYLNVILEKPLRRILLFRIYLCFTISAKINNSKDLLNSQHDGKFSIEIVLDGKKTEIDKEILKYPGNDEMYDKLTTFVSVDDMKDLISSMVGDIEKKMKDEYAKEFEYLKPPTNFISLRNYKID